MDVVVAGGHGRIALLLTRVLTDRGDHVRGIVRNPDHAGDVRAAGGEAVVCDLEHAPEPEVAKAVEHADALVFAAGAGPGSGAERKRTMDLGGALKTLAAARAGAVDRFVMVSAIGAGAPPSGEEGMAPYLRAKADADAAVTASGLAWTILRPGRLTDEDGTGRVRLAEAGAFLSGAVPRADVAAVLAAILAEPATAGRTWELVGGEDPIPDAIAALLG